MDRECIGLCDALNELPGIKTSESCCGHGERPFQVWFFAETVTALVPIMKALDHHWRVLVTHVDLPYRIAFLLEGPNVPSAGDELAEYVHADETSEA
jgi:hypothetical protein